MINHIHRTLVIPKHLVNTTRELWGKLEPEYINSLRFPCTSFTDPSEITHWCDAGPITVTAAQLLPYTEWKKIDDNWQIIEQVPGNLQKVFDIVDEKQIEIEKSNIEEIWNNIIVSSLPLSEVLDILNIKLKDSSDEQSMEN